MGRYPREVRDARLKCIDCNAPVVTTVDGRYVCVDCGARPVRPRSDLTASAESEEPRTADD